jgi:hypothetical protein
MRALAVAAVVAAATAAWYGVVRPELRDTVNERVDARIAELAPTPNGQAPVTTTASDGDPEPSVAAAPQEDGEPAFIRLSVEAGLTATADASSTIPDSDMFDLTDIRVENSLNESGIATLLINGEAAYQWSLSNIRGQLFEPSITPIRLQPGDNITFSVRCDAVGAESSKSTCTTAINIGGLIRPANDA